MSKNTLFISALENVYSSTNIYILRELEAVLLTGLLCLQKLNSLSVPLKKYI